MNFKDASPYHLLMHPQQPAQFVCTGFLKDGGSVFQNGNIITIRFFAQEGEQMKRFIFLWAVFIVTLFHSTLHAKTKTVIIGIYNWEPFISEKANNHGMFAEIATAALENKGYTIVFENYPFARIMKNLEFGTIDMSLAISPKEERKAFVEFTTGFFELGFGFIFKKEKLQYTSVSDLKNFTGGIMRGSFWAAELDNAGVRYEQVAQQIQNIKKLASDRVDFVCMPKEIAFQLLKEIGEDIRNYSFGLYKNEEQMAGISKKTKLLNLREDFESGLELIKSNGTYNRIISGYK